MVALHVSPHPDDELIGAGATLMALRDAGWEVVNLACGLGRGDQAERRRAELVEACRRAGFRLRVPDAMPDLSAAGDPETARADLTRSVSASIRELRPDVVVSPGAGDRHHGHRLVAEAVRDALGLCDGAAPAWWMWAFWGSLPQPTVATPFDEVRLAELRHALDAHRGELARTDYGRAVQARAELSALLAPELLFGFGEGSRLEAPYAELLTEVWCVGGRWLLGRPRVLDPSRPLQRDISDRDALVQM